MNAGGNTTFDEGRALPENRSVFSAVRRECGQL
jgi:hypothetical protein